MLQWKKAGNQGFINNLPLSLMMGGKKLPYYAPVLIKTVPCNPYLVQAISKRSIA